MESSLTPHSPANDSPLRGAGRLFLLGILSAAGYSIIALLSGENLHPRNPDSFSITRFLQTYAFVFLCYWFTIAPLVKGRRMDRRHLWFALAFAFLFRAILFHADLILENNIYRLMWDGHVSMRGVNPYRFAPADADTAAYRADYWPKINDPHVPTIYPPVLQFVFFLSEALYPGSVTGMKFILIAFDVGTIFLLMAALESLKRPPEWCLIYAWSPLAIKEIANSGHADSVSAFLMAAAILLMARSKGLGAAVILAWLTLTKFFAALFLPLFHRAWQWRHYTVYLLAVFILYLPFLSPGVNPFAGFVAFSKERQFNAGIFAGVEFCLRRLGGEAAEHSDVLARLTMLTATLSVAFWQTIALIWKPQIDQIIKACLLITGTLLLCSPVINPWFFVWMIPLLCLLPSRSWILLTGLVVLSYTYY
jgi:alpha-1,6-mannosyltransferase